MLAASSRTLTLQLVTSYGTEIVYRLARRGSTARR